MKLLFHSFTPLPYLCNETGHRNVIVLWYIARVYSAITLLSPIHSAAVPLQLLPPLRERLNRYESAAILFLPDFRLSLLIMKLAQRVRACTDRWVVARTVIWEKLAAIFCICGWRKSIGMCVIIWPNIPFRSNTQSVFGETCWF
jgi:hypothetical protein